MKTFPLVLLSFFFLPILFCFPFSSFWGRFTVLSLRKVSNSPWEPAIYYEMQCFPSQILCLTSLTNWVERFSSRDLWLPYISCKASRPFSLRRTYWHEVSGFNMCGFLSESPTLSSCILLLLRSRPTQHPHCAGSAGPRMTIFLLHYLSKLRENNNTIDVALGFLVQTRLLYTEWLFVFLLRHVWEVKMGSLLLNLCRTLLNNECGTEWLTKISLFLLVDTLKLF